MLVKQNLENTNDVLRCYQSKKDW